MTAILKELEIIGFKSFAEKVKINFTSGITAVVGPNGCGKSNIVEAIRWVLGEQAPGWLRSKAMADVIFNGTSNRPGIGMAEVVLRLNNPKQQSLSSLGHPLAGRRVSSFGCFPLLQLEQSTIPNPQSEIEIKRRLFRSGEGQYFLNNQPCRLKDIQEVILDTGLSEKGYFLIEQGRVDSILRSKPIERRHVFEEAAGIKVYQTKKIEADARLASTEQNLLRLNDILSEIEGQEKSLYRQVKKAEQYKKLKSRVRELEIELNTAKYHYLKTKESELTYKIDHLRGKLTGIEKNIAELETALTKEKDRREKSKSVLFRDRGLLAEDKEKHHQLEKLILCSKERLSSLQEKGRENQARIEDAKRSINKNNEQVLSQKREGERLEEEVKKRQLGLAETEEELLRVEAEITQESRQIEETKSALIDYLNETSRIKRELLNLSKEEKRNKGEIEAVLQRKIKEETRHQDLTQKVINLKEKAGVNEEKIKQGRGLTSELNNKREGIFQELCKLEQKANSLKVQLEANSVKLNTINELEDSLVGYSEGTKSVLQADFPGVRGLIADFISVPAEYETALEVVLDRSLEGIVVETTEQAANILAYLQEKGAGSTDKGRVTLFSLDRITATSNRESRIADHKLGIVGLGWLRDFVKVDSSCQSLIDFLLADVLLVQRLISLSDSFYRLAAVLDGDNTRSAICDPRFAIRWVTLDGTIISSWGMIQGGKGKGKETGLLARRRIASELAGTIEEIRGNLHSCEQKRKETAVSLAEIDKQLQTTQAELKAAEIERVVLTKDIEASGNLLTTCMSHLEQLVVEERQLGHELEVSRKEKEDLTGQCDAREQKGRKEEAQIGAHQKGLDYRQKQLKEERDSLNQAKISLAVLTQQSKEAEKTISRLNKEKEQLESSLSHLLGNEISLKEAQEKERASLLTCQEELTTLINKIAEKEAALAQQQQEKQALDQRCRQIENEMDSLRKKGLSIKDELYSLDLERAKVEVEASSLNKLIVDCGLRIADCGIKDIPRLETRRLASGCPELETDCGLRIAEERNNQNPKPETRNSKPETDWENEIEELKAKLTKLGEVNLAAPGEYEELIKRRDFLLKQQDDLIQAKADLRKLISRIDQTSKKQFLTTFLAIRNNFSEIFKRLFDGGDARILLTDDEEPLEAGVEFFVQPKGKKLSNISLLSGGERTLTSIAFLFALFMIKPSPFCLLDEVDAALDEANISRFVRLLQEFAKKTQFIVVTHSRQTMEAANYLYGITMEEAGVSKLVSVQLERAAAV